MVGLHTATAGDPKLWPSWLKLLLLGNICIYVFLGNCYAAGITTGFQELAIEFDSGFGPLTDLVSYVVIALGVSNLFWMPLAMCIGKRPTILLSMLVFIAGSIWSFKAKSLDSLFGARVVAAFGQFNAMFSWFGLACGAGSIEALGPSIIADIYIERYFATAMAAFALFLSGGSQIGPVIAGDLIADRGWRWFFILTTILGTLNLASSLVFLPETSYIRSYALTDETAVDAEKTAQIILHHVEDIGKGAPSPVNEQKGGTITDSEQNRPYAGTYWKDLISFRRRGQEERGIRAFPKQFSLPFRFVLVPAALYATLSYGVFLGGNVIISGQTPGFFAAPPYLFGPRAIGLLNLGSMVGILIAYPIAGPLTDFVSRVLDRANEGVHRAEHRIPALIAPFLLTPWGLILYAVTVRGKGSVYVAAVGYASQASGLAFVPSVVLSYIVDAYPRDSGEALVLINAGKNLIAFMIVRVNQQWLEHEGVVRLYSEAAGIQWALLLLALPLYFTGPWLKAKTMRFVRRGGGE